MDVINIIENYFEDDMERLDVATVISNMPIEQFDPLIDDLYTFYFNWQVPEHNANRCSMLSIDTTGVAWYELKEIYKKHLLYFPDITIPDPIAEFLYIIKGIPISEDKFRTDFKEKLILLSELKPFIRCNQVNLVPMPCIELSRAYQEKAQAEIDVVGNEYYNAIIAVMPQYSPETVRMALENIKLKGQVCTALNLSPLTGKPLYKLMLDREYLAAGSRLVLTQDYRVNTPLLSFKVPGIQNIEFEDVARLRNNEEAFNEWRIVFGQLLSDVHSMNPVGQHHFDAEFRAGVYNTISPLINELNNRAQMQPIRTLLIPAATTLGVGAISFSITNQQPIDALLGAGFTPLVWLVDKLINRYNKAGRQDALLKEFFGYLV